MNTSVIQEPNTNLNQILHINPHSPTFWSHNGFSSSQLPDIEMVTIQSVSYTSLKDLLQSSPTYNSGWQEIPIKNKLVKQAALAYLQPMSSPQEEKGVFGILKDECCGECRCLTWLKAVVFQKLKDVFCESRGETCGWDDDYYYDEYKGKFD